MNASSRWKPPFQRWFESDFCGSYAVRKMPRLAKLMYRSLLLSAWNTDNPPYLPNNDEDLAEMADAPSPEAWAEHKTVILERFQRTDSGDLYHRKTLAEFERALSEHERKAGGVKRRWEKRSERPKTTATARKGKNCKTALPENFGISAEIREWAAKHGYTHLEQRLEHFVGYVKANGRIYADWNQAFRNAVRDDWAKLGTQGNGKAPASASEIARRQQAGEEWRR